jgi:prepilin-type N-terminal cleavage/methylation domain-containing protein
MRSSDRRAFSLMELLTVVAIITLLVRAAVPDYTRHKETTARVIAGSRALVITAACEAYYRGHGRYPASLAELTDAHLIPPRDPSQTTPQSAWSGYRDARFVRDDACIDYSIVLEPSAPGRRDIAYARAVHDPDHTRGPSL